MVRVVAVIDWDQIVADQPDACGGEAWIQVRGELKGIGSWRGGRVRVTDASVARSHEMSPNPRSLVSLSDASRIAHRSRIPRGLRCLPCS